jgi:uncharacterized iron-regulated membrane protein
MQPNLRKFHWCLAIVFTLSFLLVVLTGFLVQHRDGLGLANRSVSRRWLPAGYRPDDPDSEIRADIVITDLHSGKIFGSNGGLIVDSAAIAWLLMMASGYGIQLVSRYRNGKKTKN